ncbi:MAG: hypothetical protein HC909_02625, partial [Blastochloris sp.]|nr:hypothetical protein [Blastochloris sp.]
RSPALRRSRRPRTAAAALLVPIDEYALKFLMERAYPNVRRKEDTDDAA